MACGARGRTPVVPAEGGRYVTVGSTSEKFNYAWNPKVNYATWATTDENTVYTGDVLVFNYPAYSDEIYKFDDEAAFQRCQFWRATKVCSDTDGEAGCTVRVDTAGTALFASGMIARCTWNSRLNITVVQRGTPRNVYVGKLMPGYTYPWNPAVNFTEWAATTTIYVGDSLVFKYPSGLDEVYKVPTQADYDSCDVRNYEMMCRSTDAENGCKSEPLTADPVFFISGVYSKCAAGMKVTVTAVAPPNNTAT
ncbi:hypothetical protein CLOM_g996 [Closterium sp. NIES-68]|nr:hypothetical protein CLOM_g996 [Closterium sp. NIES-68]GJP85061.1 hypothetical protein CLOP_g15165 [Closterium sp. NIES-67]